MPMKLDEFVKEALINVMSGVARAQDELRGDAAGEVGVYGRTDLAIEFDIATTVGQEVGKDRKVGIMVAAANLFAGAQEQKREATRNEEISRIRFSVPVHFRDTSDPQKKSITL